MLMTHFLLPGWRCCWLSTFSLSSLKWISCSPPCRNVTWSSLTKAAASRRALIPGNSFIPEDSLVLFFLSSSLGLGFTSWTCGHATCLDYWLRDTERDVTKKKKQHRVPYNFCWNPSFLLVASCLQQITVCPHARAPRGASSGVQVLWPGGRAGGQAGGPGPSSASEKRGQWLRLFPPWKGLQVLTAVINHPEADGWMRPGKGSTF